MLSEIKNIAYGSGVLLAKRDEMYSAKIDAHNKTLKVEAHDEA